MDFDALLNAASKNAKKASKQLNQLESEVSREKSVVHEQLQAERRARAELARRKAEQAKETERRREEESRRAFVIPKKKETSTVDPDKLKAYYAKKELEEKERKKQAEIEKERLMKLRVQANGGKATKKLGKHFGLNPVDLQIRFGSNNEHVETLQKRQLKEEEEIGRESSRYSNGISKALQQKRKVEEKMRPLAKEPHRVATSKANSLAGLCRRHEKTRDHFSPPRGPNEKASVKNKKLQLAAPVDFQSLLKVAEDISKGKKVDASRIATSRPLKTAQMSNGRGSEKRISDKSMRRENHPIPAEKEKMRMKERPREVPPSNLPLPKPTKQNTASNISAVNGSSSVSAPKSKEPKDSQDKRDVSSGRFLKALTPPPAIPGIIPGKKYLPGDLRYKEAMELAKRTAPKATLNGVHNPNRPDANILVGGSAAFSAPPKARPSHLLSADKDAQRMKEREQMKRKREEIERRTMAAQKMQHRVSRESAEPARQVKRNRSPPQEKRRKTYESSSNFCRGGRDDTDEEEEDEVDEEYSDMDDFIDDSGVDLDDMDRREFEETLKMVNRKYDKDKWAKREKDISERDMVSNYRRIQAEENFSRRAGYIEDIREASKGRSVRL